MFKFIILVWILPKITCKIVPTNPTFGREWVVMEGVTMNIDCFEGQSDAKQLMYEYEDAIFDWHHRDKNVPLLGEGKILFGNGTLKLIRTGKLDSGLLDCSVEMKDGSAKKTFTHSLVVYNIAEVSRVYPFVYTVPACDAKTGIKRNNLIRRLCFYWKASVVGCPFQATIDCSRSSTNDSSTLRLLVTQSLERNFIRPRCNIKCIKEAILSHLQEIGERVVPRVSKEEEEEEEKKEMEEEEGRRGVFSGFHFHREELLHTSTVMTCRSGFQNMKKIMCVPCLPGTYSKEEYTFHHVLTCRPCDYGSFQGAFGADHCKQCKSYGHTLELGSKSPAQCYGGKKTSYKVFALGATIFFIGIFFSCCQIVMHFVGSKESETPKIQPCTGQENSNISNNAQIWIFIIKKTFKKITNAIIKCCDRTDEWMCSL